MKEPIVEVSTQIIPVKHQPLQWKFNNFELFVNAQVNLVTQKFGPFFDDSTELILSLHNEDRTSQEVAKFVFKVKVKKLKEQGKQRMNLCGQIQVHGESDWNWNFFIELTDTDEASTTFELPTNILKTDTLLQFNMQYLSKQFYRNFTLNGDPTKSTKIRSKTNEVVSNNLPEVENGRENSKATTTNELTEIPPLNSTKATCTTEVKFETKWQQTENKLLHSMKKIKKKTHNKWTSTEEIPTKKETSQQTVATVKGIDSKRFEDMSTMTDEITNNNHSLEVPISISMPKMVYSHYGVHISISRPSEIPMKRTLPTKLIKNEKQQTDNIANINPLSLIQMKKSKKSIGTDTKKHQKTKGQQTDDFLLVQYVSKHRERVMKVNGSTNSVERSKSNSASARKTKRQQTDDFLFVNVSTELESLIQSMPIEEGVRMKIVDFLQKMSKLMRLREVNQILSDKTKFSMTEEFVGKLTQLLNTHETKEQTTNNEMDSNDKKPRGKQLKLEQQKLRERLDVFWEKQSALQEQINSKGEYPLEDSKTAEVDSYPDSFSLKKTDSAVRHGGNALVSPRKPALNLDIERKVIKTELLTGVKDVSPPVYPNNVHPGNVHSNNVHPRNHHLLEKIREAKSEMTEQRDVSALPQEVILKLDQHKENVNRHVHQLVTYSCLSDLDPVKLLEFERHLSASCLQMDSSLTDYRVYSDNLQHYITFRKAIEPVLTNLQTRLMPWRYFLLTQRRIPDMHQNFKEILEQFQEEQGQETIQTLEDLDMNLKEAREQIQSARLLAPQLTTHARSYLLQMEDEQTGLETNCARLLSQLRLKHRTYPSAGPWLSTKNVEIKIEGIAESSHYM